MPIFLNGDGYGAEITAQLTPAPTQKTENFTDPIIIKAAIQEMSNFNSGYVNIITGNIKALSYEALRGTAIKNLALYVALPATILVLVIKHFVGR